MKIENKKQYFATLKVLDMLIDAEVGSWDEIALNVLADAVEEYEDIHYPIK